MRLYVGLVVAAVSVNAFADENVGVPISAQLRASNGQMFAVRANKMYTARPDGFYRAFLGNVETVIYGQSNIQNAEVVFVSNCANYDGGRFTAHVRCPAERDNSHDRFVASLDLARCTSTDPSFATNFNFNQIPNAWYFSGRTGYYQSQSCDVEVAVRLDNTWLQDPINGTSNFRPQLDRSWSEATLIPGMYP